MDAYKLWKSCAERFNINLHILHFAKEVIPQKGEELIPFDETGNYFPGASYVGRIWAKLPIDEKKLIELYKQETAKKEYSQDMKKKLVLRIIKYLIGDKIDFKEHWQQFAPYAEMFSTMNLDKYEESFARPLLLLSLAKVPYLIPNPNRIAMTDKKITFDDWRMKLANAMANHVEMDGNVDFARYLRSGQWKNPEASVESLDYSLLA